MILLRQKAVTPAHQTFILITEKPQFKKDVLKIRNDWNIPENGLDPKDVEDWYEWLRAKNKQYIKSPKVMVTRKATFNKYKNVGFDDYRKRQDGEQALEELSIPYPNNQFNAAINSLIKKYNIGQLNEQIMRTYVLTNRFDFVPNAPMISFPNKPEEKNKEVNLVIGPYTTIDDVRRIWPMVHLQQKRLEGYRPAKRKKLIVNFERNMRILALKSEGKTYREIANLIRIEFKKPIGMNEVSGILASMKRKINAA